jgi:hypothetical protein
MVMRSICSTLPPCGSEPLAAITMFPAFPKPVVDTAMLLPVLSLPPAPPRMLTVEPVISMLPAGAALAVDERMSERLIAT